MEYSLQQYAAIAQAQLFADTPQQQDNEEFNMTYTPFPLIRMAPPQLHQPTLAKEIPIVTEDSTQEKPTSNTPIRVTRPPNAYLLFNKEMRKILKDQDPTMKVADISKEVGSRWKHMPKEQKDQYLQQAEKLKEEQRALHPNSMYIRRSRAELVKAGHVTKLAHDDNTIPQPPPQKRKRHKRDKNASAPKHPLSAYMWYLTEMRPETMRNFPGSNVGQISKLCADRWNTMPEASRLPWKSKAEQDKERYAKEMQIYAVQYDHQIGRGTRQKYRTAAAAAAAAALKKDGPLSKKTIMPAPPPFHAAPSLFYTPDGKQVYHHTLSDTGNSNLLLHNNLPMTLNPTALLQNHPSNHPFGN